MYDMENFHNMAALMYVHMYMLMKYLYTDFTCDIHFSAKY